MAIKAELKEALAKVEAMKESVEKVRTAFNEAVAEIKNSEALAVSPSAELTEVLESIKTVVDREQKRTEELNATLNDWQAARAAATEKLAKEKVELNRLTAINDKFFTGQFDTLAPTFQPK